MCFNDYRVRAHMYTHSPTTNCLTCLKGIQNYRSVKNLFGLKIWTERNRPAESQICRNKRYDDSDQIFDIKSSFKIFNLVIYFSLKNNAIFSGQEGLRSNGIKSIFTNKKGKLVHLTIFPEGP